jgi:hypothetical protein
MIFTKLHNTSELPPCRISGRFRRHTLTDIPFRQRVQMLVDFAVQFGIRAALVKLAAQA